MVRLTCLIVLLAAVPAKSAVGQVSFFLTTGCPSGFLPLDGQFLDGSTYNALEVAITTSGYVYLPDVNGANTYSDSSFIRGWTPGGSVPFWRNNDSAPPSRVEDSFQGHNHTAFIGSVGGFNANMFSSYGTGTSNSGTGTTNGIVTLGSYGTPRISTETRPKNFAFLACVQAEVLESGGGTNTVEQVMNVETQNFLFAIFFLWIAITGFKLGKGS